MGNCCGTAEERLNARYGLPQAPPSQPWQAAAATAHKVKQEPEKGIQFQASPKANAHNFPTEALLCCLCTCCAVYCSVAMLGLDLLRKLLADLFFCGPPTFASASLPLQAIEDEFETLEQARAA